MCTGNKHGIDIQGHSSGISVVRNVCVENDKGMYVWLSHLTDIRNNSISNNHFGLKIWRSNNLTIGKNNLSMNSLYDILITSADDSTVVKNHCSSEGSGGILLSDSSLCSVIENICSSKNSGMGASSSSSIDFLGNTCTDTTFGITLRDCLDSNIMNN